MRVAIIGAGVAGLTSAIDLARQGFDVTVFDKAASPGGKLRELVVAGRPMDAGPTVFTMREVFDQLFLDAGEHLDRHLKLVPAKVIARHAWDAGRPMDLYADLDQSIDSVARCFGGVEAKGFVAFTAHAQRVFQTLEHSFIRAPRPSPVGLTRRLGLHGLADLWNIQPFRTLWQSAGGYFKNPRLQQLFARYATYCGSSPFLAPATLMLIAHVERAGVWYVEGGMHNLALQLAQAAQRQGASFRYSCGVTRVCVARGRVQSVELHNGERVEVDAVVCAADTNALATGLLGSQVARATAPTRSSARTLSAVTWNLVAETGGFELAHHSVFFCLDYAKEFDDIFRRHRLPSEPTIYVCAQDRCDAHLEAGAAAGARAERLFCLINAPAIGDTHSFGTAEIDACESLVFRRLQQFGLQVQRRPADTVTTSPSDFHRLFPGTGGALYGPASHGWKASFARPGSRSSIPNLYLAGGSVHPGPGVPMAATSGRLAAAALIEDYASIGKSRATAMRGGTSMR